MVSVIISIMLAMLAATSIIITFSGRPLGHLRSRPFNDLVQFTSIKPNASALRTVIDFNPLPFTHHERDIANRTIHAIFSFLQSSFSVPCMVFRIKKPIGRLSHGFMFRCLLARPHPPQRGTAWSTAIYLISLLHHVNRFLRQCDQVL